MIANDAGFTILSFLFQTPLLRTLRRQVLLLWIVRATRWNAQLHFNINFLFLFPESFQITDQFLSHKTKTKTECMVADPTQPETKPPHSWVAAALKGDLLFSIISVI